MKDLVLSVPEIASATYMVPMAASINAAEARRQASEAAEARLTGPLRTLVTEWLAKGMVKVEVEVESAGTPPELLDKPRFGTPRTAGLPRPCPCVCPIQRHAASIPHRHTGMDGTRPGRGARRQPRRTRA